jgi:hypothetical protein
MKEIVVEVVDSIMGAGKSTECFNWINKNLDDKYIYVSPMLSEVDKNGRIHKEILGTEFISPDIEESRSKIEHLSKLLDQGVNIACTHNLYLSMTNEHFETIKKQGYIIILDEEIEVIKTYGVYSTSDIEYLIHKKEITVDEKDGSITWIGEHKSVEDYEHKYYKLKNLCEKKSVYLNKGMTAKKNILVSHIPLNLLTSAKRVIVITYMFEGSVLDCFLKLKGINTVPCKDIVPKREVKPESFRELITLISPNKKTVDLQMSATWWKNLKSDVDKKSVGSIANYIKNTAKEYDVKADEIIWTCPKANAFGVSEDKKAVKLNPAGYVRFKNDEDEWVYNWLSVHTRATNEYSNKRMVAHCYNRYPLQPVKVYLKTCGFPIDEERYAVSSLLQFVWRSRIRNFEPIILLIANHRMCHLFVKWMDGGFD